MKFQQVLSYKGLWKTHLNFDGRLVYENDSESLVLYKLRGGDDLFLLAITEEEECDSYIAGKITIVNVLRQIRQDLIDYEQKAENKEQVSKKIADARAAIEALVTAPSERLLDIAKALEFNEERVCDDCKISFKPPFNIKNDPATGAISLLCATCMSKRTEKENQNAYK